MAGRVRRPSFVIALLLLAPAVRADLRAQLDAILSQAVNAKATAAARVLALPEGEVLYSFRADEPMKPASNMKLITTAAALHWLGTEFAFETTLALLGEDLVVIGGGDPATGDPRLTERAGADGLGLFDQWADVLTGRGQREVRGQLVLDASVFDEQLVHPSWPEAQLQKWYAAPVAGLNLNDNCIELTVWPAEKAGEPARFSVWPPNGWVRVDNRCTSGGKGPPTVGRIGRAPQYVLNGRCATRGTLQSVAVPDPVALFGDALRTHFEARGIGIVGPTVRRPVRDEAGRLPPDCLLLDVRRTPMSDVLLRCNQDSQNLFAECLLKRLGAAEQSASGRAAPQGSWEGGQRAVERFLASLSLDASQAVIDDGSGLSHANRLSAETITEVLRHVFGHAAGDLYRTSLATPGGNGTFRNRLKELRGRLFVKTGTLKGVSTLAGYVRTADEGWLCFSLLFNDVSGSTKLYRQIQESFCRVLADCEAGAATSPASE